MTKVEPLAYTIAEAAEATGYSQQHIRRAIATTNVDPAAGVHHLPAKRDGKKYRVLAAALTKWLEQLPDA